MPTVLVIDGFQVRLYLPPREHVPAHVHVVRAGAECVIELGGKRKPVRVREIHRMRDADVIKAVRIVEEHQGLLLATWRELHG